MCRPLGYTFECLNIFDLNCFNFECLIDHIDNFVIDKKYFQTNGGKVSDALGVNKSSSWAEALFFHTWGYRGKLQLPKSSPRGEADERLFFKRVTPLPSSPILFRLFIPVAPRDILSLRLTLCFPFPLRLSFCPRVACVVSLEQTHVYISRSLHRGTKREKTQ